MLLKHCILRIEYKEMININPCFRAYRFFMLLFFLLLLQGMGINGLMGGRGPLWIYSSDFFAYQPPKYAIKNSLVHHDPIFISNDAQLINTAVSGTGGKSDPYILENWKIILNDSHSVGISITGTSESFVIRNCFIEGYTGDYYYEGIGCNITQVVNGTAHIINNSFSDLKFGVYISESQTVFVEGNVFTNIITEGDNHGISLHNSSSSIITGNIGNNFDWGIYIEDSRSTIIVNNTCNNNRDFGIDIVTSPSSIVKNNKCNNSRYSITIQNSSDSIITENSCNNSSIGILLLDSNNCSIFRNTLADNYYGIYRGSVDIENEIYGNNFFNNYEDINSDIFPEDNNIFNEILIGIVVILILTSGIFLLRKRSV
jgi:parallel beta-helix repeat protein